MPGVPTFMLDTNIASFIIRGGTPTLMNRLQAHPVTSVCISAITEAELRYGLARRPGATALQAAVRAFLLHVEALAWDSEAAARYGELRAALKAAGRPMGGMDMLIAAHALAAGVTLVSHDRAFKRISGLRIEDWTAK
jgi:tRNA(fMet)-specific endonuclease VapC